MVFFTDFHFKIDLLFKMADFGDTDPLFEHDDDDNDGNEDVRNTTTPFKPDFNSNPGLSGEDIPMTTMNRGQEKASETAETYFIEGDTSYSRVITSVASKDVWLRQEDISLVY